MDGKEIYFKLQKSVRGMVGATGDWDIYIADSQVKEAEADLQALGYTTLLLGTTAISVSGSYLWVTVIRVRGIK